MIPEKGLEEAGHEYVVDPCDPKHVARDCPMRPAIHEGRGARMSARPCGAIERRLPGADDHHVLVGLVLQVRSAARVNERAAKTILTRNLRHKALAERSVVH